MSRFANLKDRAAPIAPPTPSTPDSKASPDLRTYREGRKAITGYFSPEMSFALHMCAPQWRSLQALMGEAFDDVPRKYGETPIGNR